MGLLPSISDEKLKRELEQEIDHPFPCFITFEGKGKEQNLLSVARRRPDAKYGLEEWETPTHIPFEDRYRGVLAGQDIREIRVPQNQMEKVQGWLEVKGLKGVKIVPIEVYEVKRIIQGNV